MKCKVGDILKHRHPKGNIEGEIIFITKPDMDGNTNYLIRLYGDTWEGDSYILWDSDDIKEDFEL